LVDSELPPQAEWLALGSAYHEVAAVIGWDRAVQFGFAVWQTKRTPSHAAYDPIHGGGRGDIYIPTALTEQHGQELVRLAGAEDAALLVKAFPGTTLGFQCLVRASIPRRDRAIAEQVKDGWSVAVVAVLFDLGEKQVRRICQKQGVSPTASLPAARALRRQRREGVREAVRAGGSIEDVAREWGFTVEAVQAICE
jgi:hypothetical protein